MSTQYERKRAPYHTEELFITAVELSLMFRDLPCPLLVPLPLPLGKAYDVYELCS